MGERKRIEALGIDSGTITPLTSGVAAILPALSPDGLRSAYTAGPDAPDWRGSGLRAGVVGRGIWLLDADGSNQRGLTDGEDYREERPQGTADGRVVFVRVDADGLVSLWQMRPGDLEGPQIIETIVDATVPKEQVEALQY